MQALLEVVPQKKDAAESLSFRGLADGVLIYFAWTSYTFCTLPEPFAEKKN